jgi:hypothetical protein
VLSDGSTRQRRFIALCHPGRGLETVSIDVFDLKMDVFELKIEGENKPGGDQSPPSGIGPWRGARVAPQHCPILRPGQRKRRQKEFIVAINNKRRTSKEDIPKELRLRTFLKSCNILKVQNPESPKTSGL